MDARAHSSFVHRLVTCGKLPSDLEATRTPVLYFALLSADVLSRGGARALLPAASRAAAVEWLYSRCLSSVCACARCLGGGERGAPCLGFSGGAALPPPAAAHLGTWSVASGYAAVCSLLMLGDDCARVPRAAVARGLASLQEPLGGALGGAVHSGPSSRGEADPRFVYSAVALCVLLRLPMVEGGGAGASVGEAASAGVGGGAVVGEGVSVGEDVGAGVGASREPCPSALDPSAAAAFLVSLQSPEGGIALTPGGEAHGGSTYCALAALALLRRYGGVPHSAALGALDRSALLRWLSMRQEGSRVGNSALGEGGGSSAAALREDASCADAREGGSAADVGGGGSGWPLGGLNGRTGKDADACYAWWVGASLQVLHEEECAAAGVSAAAVPSALGGSSVCTSPAQWLSTEPLAAFLLACQGPPVGDAPPRRLGFGRDPDAEPDPLHTAYALAGLALLQRTGGADGGCGLEPLHAALGLTVASVAAAGVGCVAVEAALPR